MVAVGSLLISINFEKLAKAYNFLVGLGFRETAKHITGSPCR